MTQQQAYLEIEALTEGLLTMVKQAPAATLVLVQRLREMAEPHLLSAHREALVRQLGGGGTPCYSGKETANDGY